MSGQNNLEFDQERLESRQPIAGFPELHWTGKRPFTVWQFYPAQLKEVYGEPDEQNGWMNKIYWGDNFQVMNHLMRDFRGKIDLIYIDPPFDSKADYKKKIEVKTLGLNKAESDFSAFEEKQYKDLWMHDEYLQFMFERLLFMRELLSDTGSIYVHMDEKRVHYMRLLLDEVFGISNFRREIIWDITVLSGFKVQAMNWIRGHDSILYYSKTSEPVFNKLRQPHSQGYIDMFNKIDDNGDKYMIAHGITRYLKDVINKGKPYGDVWDDILSYQLLLKQLSDVRNLEQLEEILSASKTCQNISDVWDNIMSFQQQPTSSENCAYPTQKPEKLLERIILASSNPGDLVMDCFMGSGTTQAVAMKLGRRFIGADINLGAVHTATKRLLNIAADIKAENKNENEQSLNKYTGFEVYNVNNYEFFRNPAQARSLLIDALGIQEFPEGSSIWDGELDGRMVKIMPVNRIASKSDLKDLIDNLPYKKYESISANDPSEPVERITLVCMGHEPDLKAHLQYELIKYKVDIEILDILKDRKDLQLKRESEAEVVRDGNKLVIKNFYPLNLMNKLSCEKEYLDDWRTLTDSVLIDWYYDGAVMQPIVTDIPGKNELVKGVYDIPDDAGTIRIKITDLLSESLELEVK